MPLRPTFSLLPLEIVDKILYNLDQSGKLHLALTCRSVRRFALKNLFDRVSLGSFGDGSLFRELVAAQPHHASRIRTLSCVQWCRWGRWFEDLWAKCDGVELREVDISYCKGSCLCDCHPWGMEMFAPLSPYKALRTLQQIAPELLSVSFTRPLFDLDDTTTDTFPKVVSLALHDAYVGNKSDFFNHFGERFPNLQHFYLESRTPVHVGPCSPLSWEDATFPPSLTSFVLDNGTYDDTRGLIKAINKRKIPQCCDVQLEMMKLPPDDWWKPNPRNSEGGKDEEEHGKSECSLELRYLRLMELAQSQGLVVSREINQWVCHKHAGLNVRESPVLHGDV